MWKHAANINGGSPDEVPAILPKARYELVVDDLGQFQYCTGTAWRSVRSIRPPFGDGSDGDLTGSDKRTIVVSVDKNFKSIDTTDTEFLAGHNTIIRCIGNMIMRGHLGPIGWTIVQTQNGIVRPSALPNSFGSPGVGLGAILAALGTHSIPPLFRNPKAYYQAQPGGVLQILCGGMISLSDMKFSATPNEPSRAYGGGSGGGLIILLSRVAVRILGCEIDVHGTNAFSYDHPEDSYGFGGGGGYSGERGGHAGYAGSAGASGASYGAAVSGGYGYQSGGNAGSSGLNGAAGAAGGGCLDGDSANCVSGSGAAGASRWIHREGDHPIGLTAATAGAAGYYAGGGLGARGGGGGGGGGGYSAGTVNGGAGGDGGDCGSGGGGGGCAAAGGTGGAGGDGADGSRYLYPPYSTSIHEGCAGGNGGGGGGGGGRGSTGHAGGAGGSGGAGRDGKTPISGSGAGAGGRGNSGLAGGAGTSTLCGTGGAGGNGGDGGGAAGMLLIIAPEVEISSTTVDGRLCIIDGPMAYEILAGAD